MSALDRMIARVTGYPVVEGSLVFDALSPVAAELDSITDEVLPEALDAVMPDTAVADDLDRVALVYGVTRKGAVAAAGEVTFVGTVGTLIAAGTPVSTATGLIYVTTIEETIPDGGSVTVPITANGADAEHNVGIGEINTLPVPLAGVTSVSNAAAVGGGTAAESDDALRVRLLLRIKLPSASGTSADYVRWALEVPGVAAAQCIGLWNGAGTVKVVIAGPDMTSPDEATRQRAADYIEAVRPIGATVTVVSAQTLAVNVAATLTLAATYTTQSVQADVEAAIGRVLQDFELGSGVLSYARVGAALLTVQGVLDYSGMTINGAAGNLSLTAEQIPTLAGVTLS